MHILERPNLAEDIANSLKQKIICLELRPGEQLKEINVKEEFKVSNGPIREAFQILEKYHLVEIIPRRGVWVSELSSDFIRCLFEIMIELIGFVIRCLCKNYTEKELETFLEMKDKAIDFANNKNVAGYYSTTNAIMQKALGICHNPLLEEMVENWTPSLQRAYFLSLSQCNYNLEDSVGTLITIYEHVVGRNAALAELTVRAYLSREQERVLKITNQFFTLDTQQSKDPQSVY